MHNPSNAHWTALKWVLEYLKGTIQFGILFSVRYDFSISIFSDANWTSCPDDRISTTSYVVYLGSNPITWSSKKQHTIARSSTESKFRVVANAISEVTWIQFFLF